MKARPDGLWRTLLAWLPLVPLFYLPVLFVLGGALRDQGGRAALFEFAGSPLCRHVLGFTLWESLLSALGSILIAFPGAYIVGRYEFRGKRVIRGLLVLPFVLPSIIAVLAMVVTFGWNGAFNGLLRLVFGPEAAQFHGLYSLAGIVLTHVFFNFALGIRLIGEAWERLDRGLTEAASSLGAGPAAVWRTVVLPLLWPSMAAAFTLAFIYAGLNFTTVLVFGGIRYRTLEVLIYSRLNQDLDFQGAYAVALVQMTLAGLLLAVRARVTRRRRRVSSAFGLPSARPLPGGWPRVPMIVYGLLLAAFFLGPLGILLLRAWRPGGEPGGPFTSANYAALFSSGFRTGAGQDFWRVCACSLGLACAVGLSVVLLSYVLSALRGERRSGTADAIVELPLGASLVTLCFGLSALYGQTLPPAALVFMAQVVTGLPLGYMAVRAARAELGRETVWAARSLGAGWWRALRDIEIPLLRRSLLTAFAYGAAFSLGDVAAVMILGQGRVVTFAVALYRLLGHYRFPQALALGSLLLVLSLGLFLLAELAGEQNRWAGEYGAS